MKEEPKQNPLLIPFCKQELKLSSDEILKLSDEQATNICASVAFARFKVDKARQDLARAFIRAGQELRKVFTELTK